MSHNQHLLQGKLQNISFTNFKTLGARQWIDDEVMNYFVNKWCTGSFTLGLNTFFACKILFKDDDNSCVNARCGVLMAEDAKKALKWCRRAEVCFASTIFLPGSLYSTEASCSSWGMGLCFYPNQWKSLTLVFGLHWFSSPMHPCLW